MSSDQEVPSENVPKFLSFPSLPSQSSSSGGGLAPHTRREKRRHYSSSSSSYSSDDDRYKSRKEEHVRKDRSRSKGRKNRSRERRKDKSDRKRKDKKHRKEDKDKTRKKPTDISRSERFSLDTGTYFIDRRGDTNNLVYGGTYKYEVPRYRRSGGGKVLGLPPNYRISRKRHEGSAEIIEDIYYSKKDKKNTRYMHQILAPMDNGRETERLPIRKSHDPTPFWINDFVPLDDDEDTKQTEDSILPDYRDITLGTKSNDGDTNVLFTEVEEIAPQDKLVRQKIKEYTLQLAEHSQDVDLWIEFIEFQDKAMQIGKKLTSSATASSINEVKLSIYEKALTANPGNEKLLLGYLKCAERLWKTPELLGKWDEVMATNSQSVSLWMEYIDFRQTLLSGFTVKNCEDAYAHCIAVLKQQLHEDPERIELALLRVFMRVCFFLRDSGFTEKAYACWQAMMEITFFAPKELHSSNFEDIIEALEEFWGSEKPRFGEKGAKGWSFYHNGEDSTILPQTTSSINLESLPSSEDKFTSWLHQERALDSVYRYSLRTDDLLADADASAEDPFRLVLFDDIRNYIFPVRTQTAMTQLIYGCFNYLGLNFNPCIVSKHSLFTDSFLHYEAGHEIIMKNKFFHALGEPDDEDAAVGTMDNKTKERGGLGWKYLDFPIKAFPQQVDNLFNNGKWFAMYDDLDISNADVEFAGEAFVQLKNIAKNIGVHVWNLVPPHFISGSEGVKSAKELLNTDRSNLLLWNWYAQLEKSRGNIDKAREIYKTAIVMGRSYGKEYEIDAPFLYRMFAELEIEQGERTAALNILQLQSEEAIFTTSFDTILTNAPNMVKLLKARRSYEQQMEQLASLSTLTDARVQLERCCCFALMQYLNSGLEKACEVFDRLISLFETLGELDSVNCELTYIAYPLLNLLVVTKTNEERSKIAGRVRSQLDIALASKPNHVLWTFALYAEMRRHQNYNVNFIRSLFERAAECPKSRHSVAIWSLYINFEKHIGDLERAKAIYFRALRECPWAKSLILEAFTMPSMTDTEKESVMGLMMSTGMRLRVSFDDYE
ncbi:2727_t:CDS:10 [Paraglomus occultum]|uniref:2727_t:CDS:1 n=1 Tax=Paraglomus occultum TaxID=144539 RepID=A0A9N9BYF5_9GLOM|nr:2727_t:CDS:10 [Paraglomus occultum]